MLEQGTATTASQGMPTIDEEESMAITSQLWND